MASRSEGVAEAVARGVEAAERAAVADESVAMDAVGGAVAMDGVAIDEVEGGEQSEQWQSKHAHSTAIVEELSEAVEAGKQSRQWQSKHGHSIAMVEELS